MDTPQARGFGEVLRRHRVAAGLTQEALAEQAHLSTRAISALEQGVNRTPRNDTVTLLADALALSREERSAFEAAARRPPPVARLPSHGALVPGVVAASPLIGRAAEMDLVQRHLAGEGPPVLLLCGEPGIGKSRLLHEGMGRAVAAGWSVLQGGCHRRRGQDPYTPLVDALAWHVQGQTPAQQRVGLRGCAWLVRLLPELASAPIEPLPGWTVSPEQERRLMFAGVARYLANAAGPAGTLLVLDDLQWAGTDALDLLFLLARQAGDVPLRVLGAYRDTEVRPDGALPAVLADLAGARLIRQHTLRPLGPDDASLLLNSLLESGRDADDELRAQVLARTGGVPFFLVSCVEALRLGDGGDPRAIPWDVIQGVRQRIAALPETARAVVEVASVAGRASRRALLLRVVSRPEREVVGALQAACRAHVLEEAGPTDYCFAHDMIREVVEGDLGTPWRMLLHRDIAQTLEELDADNAVEMIAYHYGQTDQHATAARWLEQAGDRAAAGFASAAALGHYAAARERLLALSMAGEGVSRLNEKLGDLHRNMGDYAAAQEDFARARKGTTDSIRRAELWRKEGTTWSGRWMFGQALAAFDAADTIDAPRPADDESAAPSAGSVPPLVRAAVEISRAEAHFHQGTYEQAWDAAERAIALLSTEPPSNAIALTLAHAHHYLGEVARRYQGDAARAEHHLLSSLAVRQRLGTQEDIAWSTVALGLAARLRGDLDEAEEHLVQGQLIMERIGHAMGIAWTLGLLGGVALQRGNLAAAEDVYRRLGAIATRMDSWPFLREMWGGVGYIAWLRGDLAGADECYQRCQAVGNPNAADASLSWAWVERGRIASERGDLSAAWRWMRAARRLARRAGAAQEEACAGIWEAQFLVHSLPSGEPAPRSRLRAIAALLASSRTLRHEHEAWVGGMAALVTTELLLHQGLLVEARSTAEEGLAVMARRQWRREEALAWRLLGQCAVCQGVPAEGEAHLRKALNLQTEMGMALDAGHTRLLLAEVLLSGAGSRAIREEAGRLLAEARAQFSTSGALLGLAEVDRLAAAVGIPCSGLSA